MPKWTQGAMENATGNQCRSDLDELGRWIGVKVKVVFVFRVGPVLALGTVKEDISAFSLLKNTPFPLTFR